MMANSNLSQRHVSPSEAQFRLSRQIPLKGKTKVFIMHY